MQPCHEAPACTSKWHFAGRFRLCSCRLCPPLPGPGLNRAGSLRALHPLPYCPFCCSIPEPEVRISGSEVEVTFELPQELDIPGGWRLLPLQAARIAICIACRTQ